jgi:hypothetical protein
MSLNASQFWLTDLKYVEEKRAVLLEFSRLGFRRTSREPFFPSFFVKKSFLGLGGLKEILFRERLRFKITETGTCFKVSAGTFSDLGLLAEALFKETGFRPLVLEPERQFLLEKGWSYFDSFSFFSEKEFAKDSSSSFPNAKVRFFSEPLPETIGQLFRQSPETARKTISLIALSRLLKTKMESIPSSSFIKNEIFLENALWTAGLSCRQARNKDIPKDPETPRMPDLAEVDFSGLWATLFTKPFFNLGPDTIGCSCCKPKTIFETNLLPSSLVSVEMQKDGFFFESCSAAFSQAFHKSNCNKESRLRRQREFFLKNIPVGPFFRKQSASIPLADAVRLREEGNAKIVSLDQPSWFCLESESLVSKALSELSAVIDFSEKTIEQISLESVKQHRVLSFGALSKNLDYLLLESMLGSAEEIVSGMPAQLSSEKSAFYSEKLCSAVQAIQSNVLEHFHRFASENKSRVILKENKAFLRSEKPNTLVKQFAQNQAVSLKTAGKRL